MLRIDVQDVRRGTQRHVLASCRVSFTTDDLETITLNDVRVLRNKTGELWVGYPNQPVRDFEGTIKYVPDMEFSRELKHRISEAVLKEFERDDAQYDVIAAEMQRPAVRPVVKPVRQPIIGVGNVR